VKIELRWQLLLAAVCVAFLISLLGFQIQSAGECTTQIPSSGGRLVEGRVGQPQYLNPLLSKANPVDQELVSLLFDGLTRYNDQGLLEPALAQSWEVNDEGTTYRFDLREDIVWHDGEPFNADDVVFTYGLLQHEDFSSPNSLKELWSSVTISSTDEFKVDFILDQPYSPFLDATTLGILPEHLLGQLPPDEIADQSFNRSPVGTGPFLVVPGNDFRRDGFLLLAPNPRFWRGGAALDTVEYRFYPDGEAIVEAFEEGEIHALTSFPHADIEKLGALPGIRLYSSGAPRFTQMIFNLTDSASPAIRRPEIRRALIQSLNRETIIDQALSGQGLPLDGPYLPDSWAFNPFVFSNHNYQPEESAAVLESLGWVIAEGSQFRSFEGEPLRLRILAPDDPSHVSMAGIIADQWANIGVDSEIKRVGLTRLDENLQEREYDVALVDIEPINDPDLYDFWSQEAIVNGQNYGGWNNRRASESLESARKLTTVEERRPHYDAFLQYFVEEVPAFTLFQHVWTYGISDEVNEVDIGQIHSPRDRYQSYPDWYLEFREAATFCPEADA
jgi:peptide/nickel transport system substrate-binding protein